MSILNKAVQMISLCHSDGEMVPIRFRTEGESGELVTVKIKEVLNVRPNKYVGIESYIYTCRIEAEGRGGILEIRYIVPSHKWVLFKSIC